MPPRARLALVVVGALLLLGLFVAAPGLGGAAAEGEAGRPPPPADGDPGRSLPHPATPTTAAPTVRQSPVSIVVALTPSIDPAWLYPNALPCPGVVCHVHYNVTPQDYGVTEANKRFLASADIYAVYINGPMHDEFYDVHRNPFNLTLMVSSNECMKGRETVLANMKHWWIHRFAQDEGYWRHFHISHTLEQGSTIPWSYLNYLLAIPEVPVWVKQNPPLPMAQKYTGALALFMSSHPGHTYNRFQIVRDISMHMKLDYYGKGYFKNYFRKVGGAPNVTRRERRDCPFSTWYEPTATLCMIRPYFFNFAFENSIALDYVTEKLYDPLLAGVVPVYKGAPNVENFVPPHSIVKVDDFEHPAHLAYYLRCVAADRELYEYYRQWEKRSSPSWERLRRAPHPFCRACQLVAAADPVLRDVERRIPRPLPLRPENVGNQRPFRRCLMPGTRLRNYNEGD